MTYHYRLLNCYIIFSCFQCFFPVQLYYLHVVSLLIFFPLKTAFTVCFTRLIVTNSKKQNTANLYYSCWCRYFRKRCFYRHTRASELCMGYGDLPLHFTCICVQASPLGSCVCIRRTKRSLGCCFSSSGASRSNHYSNTPSFVLGANDGEGTCSCFVSSSFSSFLVQL